MADRILLVEDNEALRVGIRLALDDAGYAVQEASSGEEAIRKLESEPFHLVVSDIRLGDMSGVDVLQKAKEVNSEIEVILMTAYATVETAVQALRLGAFDYIQKPFEIETSHAPGPDRLADGQDARRTRILPEGRVPERPWRRMPWSRRAGGCRRSCR